MRSNAVRKGLLSAFLALLSVAFGYAQVDRGGMVGTVTDSSGAVVPGVALTLTETGTGLATKVTSGETGQYVATLLHIGTYTVSAEKEGFQKTVQGNVVVGVNQVVRVDMVLQVGATMQQVTVSAAPPQIESQASSLGTIETSQRITDLPLNGRNFLQLAFLGPGANQGSQGTVANGGGTDNNRPGLALAVNGLNNWDNNFLLDGVDNNEWGNGTPIVQPAPDAIAEFRVEENSMKAEFGRGGAAVSLVLKSGTNQFHGGVYEFIRNNKLDARNFFEQNRTSFQRNQYGFEVGGPIKKDRTFIFGDFQSSPIRQAMVFVSTVPTALMRQGNFTEAGTAIYNPYTTAANGERQLINPETPDIITGSNLINAAGQNIINRYPLPNLPGTANNFLYTPEKKVNAPQYDIRLDHRLSEHDQLFFHDALQQVDEAWPAPLGPAGGCCSGYGSNINGRYQSWGAGWTHSLTPTLLNDMHGGYFRYSMHSLHFNTGQQISTAMGIPNANRGDLYSSGESLFYIGNLSASGDSSWVPETPVENTFQIADTISWIHGRHTAKFGGEFIRRQRNFFQAQAPFGQFSFGNGFTSDPALGGGNAIADTLLGLPINIWQDTLHNLDYTRFWDMAYFAQDDFRVKPNLTVNLGIRYDLIAPYTGPSVGNFDFKTLTINTGPHGGVSYDKKDLGPRVGFAYTADKKTVLRGAFGMFYDPEANVFNDIGENPPNLVSYNLSYSTGAIPTPQQLVSAGFPAVLPNLDPAHPTQQAKTTGPEHRMPYILEWNFNVERQLAPNWVLEVGYVGTRGLHLWNNETYNFDQPYQPLDSNFTDSTGNLGRPYFNQLPLMNTIYPIDYPNFDMFYHALNVKLTKHFSNGLNFLASYGWAKDLGTNLPLNGNLPKCGVQNVNNIAEERGYVGADFAHRFVISYLYELPYGKGKHFGNNINKATDLAIGGWEVSGVTILRTGERETAYTSQDYTNTGTYGPRPDRIANPTDFSFDVAGQAALGCDNPGHRDLSCWYNPAAFAVPALAPGQKFAHQFGNGGNGTLLGPGQVNFDFGLIKHLKATERVTVDFRAEFFNIFNHPEFAIPNAAPDIAGGAAITGTLPDNQREIQFGLKVNF